MSAGDVRPPNEDPGVAASARVEELLRGAGLLLARGSSLRAVRLLHGAAGRALGTPEPAEAPFEYTTARQAEEEHRRLSAQSQRRAHSQRGWRLSALRSRLPHWASWALVCLAFGVPVVGYASALVQRVMWQREHPEGRWISRYYESRRFIGAPVVRYDVGIHYDWGTEPVAGAMPRMGWSARWNTCLVVSSRTKLDLRLRARHLAKLFVDEKRVLESRSGKQKKRTVALEPGVHHLRVDFVKTRGKASISLDGLDDAGTENYRLERPVLDGEVLRCDAAGGPP